VNTLKKIIILLIILPVLISCNAKEITSDKLEKQVFPVKVAIVTKTNLSNTIELSGLAVPSLIYPILSPSPTLVEEVYIKVGDKVSKGDVLIKLNEDAAKEQYSLAKRAVSQLNELMRATQSTRGQQAIEQYDQLKKELDEAVKRSQALLAGMDTGAVTAFDLAQSTLEVSLKQAQVAQAAALLQQGSNLTTFQLESQLLEANQKLKQAEMVLENMSMKAPISGYVSELNVFENGITIPNRPAATIINIDTINATFQLNSYQVSNVEQGMSATVTFEGVENTYRGVVSTLSPTANVNTNTFQVQIPITNKEVKIKGGMKATAHLTVSQLEKAMVIPTEAIIYEDEQTYVFVVDNQKAIKKEITVGFRSGNLVQVISGLSEADKIITSGKERLTTGALIQVRK
jgi:HlyD family secretion protein